MKFKKHFEDLLKNRLVLNLLVTIILAVIEEIMELEFTCAPHPFNIGYFVMFLIAPAFIFSILNWIVQRYILNSIDVKKDSRWSTVSRSAFPFCMWLAIVFLDGRYFQCALSTDHSASKKPTNIEMSALSKMIGLGILFLITLAMIVTYYIKKPQVSTPVQNVPPNAVNLSSLPKNQSVVLEGLGTEKQPGAEGEAGPGPSVPGTGPCNQSVVLECLDTEKQPGAEGEASPGPSVPGTASKEEEKVQANQGRAEELERTDRTSEELEF